MIAVGHVAEYLVQQMNDAHDAEVGLLCGRAAAYLGLDQADLQEMFDDLVEAQKV